MDEEPRLAVDTAVAAFSMLSCPPTSNLYKQNVYVYILYDIIVNNLIMIIMILILDDSLEYVSPKM